jgi:hypothetical protein
MITPIAVAVADLHLTLTSPACRDESDWPAVQARYLQQLGDIAGNLPILCAGDIFDKWNTPPELINFALENLPDGMLCVPGQHDLPNHRIEDMHKSGYGVMKRVGKIRDISGISTGNMGGFIVHGFGWGQPIQLLNCKQPLLNIALIHHYCWMEGKAYPGAPEELHIKHFKKLLQNYDFAIFGDNHKGFCATLNQCHIVNCGGFTRRKSDERLYKPSVWKLYKDGTDNRMVERIELDCMQDRFSSIDKLETDISQFNADEFIQELERLGEHGLNFRETVKRYLHSNDIHPLVCEMIFKAMN